MIHRSGVVHAAVQDGSVQQINFWLPDVSIYDVFTRWLTETYRYDTFAFTPYSNATNWNENFGDTTPISQVISPQNFLRTVMQTQQRSNSTQQEMDIEEETDDTDTTGLGLGGFNLFSPPNLRRRPQDAAGINVTPATQQRPPAGGLSELITRLMRGTDPNAHPQGDPPGGTPPGDGVPGGSPAGNPPVPPQEQPQPSVANLLQQLLQQHFQAQVPPVVPPPATPPVDPTMTTILAMMQAQQAQTTAVLRALQGGNKPSLSFPTWDGQSSTKGLFIERLKTFQKDEYFARANWTKKAPAFQKHSTWLRDAILKSLPEDYLATFKDRREFEDDGFSLGSMSSGP
jgi:hypothetical protein